MFVRKVGFELFERCMGGFCLFWWIFFTVFFTFDQTVNWQQFITIGQHTGVPTPNMGPKFYHDEECLDFILTWSYFAWSVYSYMLEFLSNKQAADSWCQWRWAEKFTSTPRTSRERIAIFSIIDYGGGCPMLLTYCSTIGKLLPISKKFLISTQMQFF